MSNKIKITVIEPEEAVPTWALEELEKAWKQGIRLRRSSEKSTEETGEHDLYVISDKGTGQDAMSIVEETRLRDDHTPILIVAGEKSAARTPPHGKVEIVDKSSLEDKGLSRTIECVQCLSRWKACHSEEKNLLERQILDFHDTSARLEGQMADFVEMAESLDEAKKEAEVASKIAEQYAIQVETILHTAVDAILTVSLDGRINSVNAAAVSLFGYAGEEMVGREFESILPNVSRETLEMLAKALKDQEMDRTIEQSAVDSHGRHFPAEVSVGNMKLGEEDLYTCVVRDITERVRAQQAIRELALKDPLTGLANRNLFGSRLADAIENARRLKTKVALLLIDLDLFKQVNDNFGHPVGDSLLREVAFRLEQATRSNDTVARLGGDEFAIVMANLESTDVVNMLASRVLEGMTTAFNIEGALIEIGASVGIAFYPDDDVTAEELTQKADLALYQSKEESGSNYQIYNKQLQKEIRARKVLEDELRLAIVREGLTLHYQPQIELRSGEVKGVEALVRWQHPVRGNIPPLDFIPIAEASGLVIPLGELVLRQACRQGKLWQDMGHPLRVAVNFSVRQFRDDGILDSVANILQETGFDPGLLELELTETMMVDDVELICKRLSAFRDIGVTLAIDDFGTGYSSLAYLKQFPIDRLKIDRAFVSELPDDNQDCAIVEAMVRLAEALGITAIAEGVENAEQAACLHQMGYHEIQGFHYCRPLSAKDFEKWLVERE